ncbi:TolC family protein [Pseudaestuariivita sp.]|uniref:TolC family protein n=1 Tax=Pseudaestuariivita sp. TaxID=2211669 RepID=UPI004059B6E8
MGRKQLGAVCLAASLALAGCGEGGAAGDFVSRFKSASPEPSDQDISKEAAQRQKEAEESAVIRALQTRPSVLSTSGPYAEVSDAVMAASARAAEAELQAARLRASAASKNWLPKIGPNISLSSMGDFVASLVIEQVLFDNGRLKAERAFAKADVEVAAVTLSDDTNERVYEALSLYLTAEEGRETAARAATSLKDMAHFEWVMHERVKGGVSDMSDLNVLRHKLSEIRATQSRGHEMTAAALAELNAMSARPIDDVRGINSVNAEGVVAEPLSVLLAEAEAARKIAGARLDRAGALPGVKATGSVSGDGSSGAITLGDGLLGLGTGDTLKALKAVEDGAARDVAEAREDAARTVRALEATLAAKHRQSAEADTLARNAKKNLDLFQSQYQGGTRQVMDVVGVYETYAAAEERRIQLRYEAARTELEIARELGVLADGASI